MSHQFNYFSSEPPSEPQIDVIISNDFGLSSPPKKALIDTGSFITIIPKSLVESLKLEVRGKVKEVYGFNTQKEDASDYDAYFVHVTIGSITFELLKVISEDQPYVLIGRDLINLWHLKLDGENLIGDIVPWSTDPTDVR